MKRQDYFLVILGAVILYAVWYFTKGGSQNPSGIANIPGNIRTDDPMHAIE